MRPEEAEEAAVETHDGPKINLDFRLAGMPALVAAPRAPYSLEPTAFAFPSLAAMVGRAALGGPREAAMACLLVGRVVRDAVVLRDQLTPEQLKQRALTAKHWLGAAAIQPQLKTALGRLADATSSGDAAALKVALDGVMTVTANHLDQGARLELGRLAQAIAG
jgi:hypothetical protein